MSKSQLEQLILEENESVSLDFKAIQYKKEKLEDFLIDINAMANAITKKSKYIVVGVKAYPDGRREYLGINEAFTDEANYQKLVHDKIEPEIHLDYFPLEMNGVTLGVFHISECDDPPYMFKASYNKIKKGSCHIRIGTHQTEVTRIHIDKFFAIKMEKQKLIDKIDVLVMMNGSIVDEIKPMSNLSFPSDHQANEIKRVIENKKKQLDNSPKELHNIINRDFVTPNFLVTGYNAYENRSIETLEENLKNIKSIYKEDDLYYLFEECSFKLNFELLNRGKGYLEDATIEIELERNDGLLIASKIFHEPDNRSLIDKKLRPKVNVNFEHLHYPKVQKRENVYKISEDVGNIKHHIPCEVFKVPVRLVLSKKFDKDNLEFMIKVYAKNLQKPLENRVSLNVTK